MMPGWVVLASLSYAALLFAVAWIGDRYPLYRQRPWLRPAVYSLALAVYCSSWTFYGAVGSAVRYGIGYLPIYLGPILLLLFGWRILERMALIAQSQNTVSIADFMASRYGRSQGLAAIVALIALIAAVPYLALQYKAVAISLDVLSGADQRSTTFGDPALYVAALMALFSILFGTRQVDATEHRPGLMLAVAFESLVKLVALVVVGLFAMSWFTDNGLKLTDATWSLIESTPPVGFAAQTLLAFTAAICLPRQFHVTIVECGEVSDIRRARWMFTAYLVIICLMVLPIASAGAALFGAHGTVAPDSFVLAPPLSQNQVTLALIAYIGGFSAATGMVIVVNVALSTMVSNDLVMPLLLRRGWAQTRKGNVASIVLWIRRAAIMALAAMAYGYYRASSSDTALASFGLITFAAVAQFGPGLIGGLYWRGASRQGVQAGLLLGFSVWIYTLLLPSLADAGWFEPAWLSEGLFGLEWLRPHQLFGADGWDPLTHGTFWSLLFNIAALMLVSARWRPGLGERMRAEPFLNPYAERPTLATSHWQGNLMVQDLLTLAGRIVGKKTVRRAFLEQARLMNQTLEPGLRADHAWVHFTELLLAAAVGAASARLVLTSALQGSGMEVAAVVAVLDEAGQELRFNRDILLATMENIDQGVSVVDAEMKLVAWNQRYQQLFNYPAGMLYVGRSVADLIRFNAESGQIGDGPGLDIQSEIDKRVAFMQAGSSHVYQRILKTGQVIELRGQPLPSGGYVTSYSDVTDYKRVERELREINETLEQRVTQRTQEAELAQKSRTQFLTAVSHDVLQPINAARLFSSALREEEQPDELKRLAERIDTSLRAAEELLDGLLDISRLDAGVLKPEITDFDASQLLQQLLDQYAPMALRRGLELRLHARPLYVRSDRRLLRRVLQNFLANALRYTRSGRIVLAARVRGANVVFQIWDTGPGIPPHHLRQIYDEFHRYEQPFDWDGRGLGLGLSICQRIALLLQHKLDAHSQAGKGSMFSISAPRVMQVTHQASPVPAAMHHDTSLKGLKVLCLDNDPDILAGMQALLGRWGINPICASTVDEALNKMQEQPDVLLVDYHLHDRMDGLDSLDALCALAPGIQGALLTADGSDTLKQNARQRGYRVLTKPVKPASLRAFLSAQSRRS
ncbi:hybrid sensor histidine kinase/response regulator [Alcaligenaceae bacterium]|nr:hybrid sensor histidine kinase/response regulator [Alcaligenaceae bacterium]